MENIIFNPCYNNFKKFLNDESYVDKTDFIFELNKRIDYLYWYICVILPKCFLYSELVVMLTACYSYSEKETTIFDDKKLSKIESQSNIKYNNKSENNKIKLNTTIIII